MTINQALQHLLAEYGRAILQDHKRVEAFLRDLCNKDDQRREVNLVMLALKEGVSHELIAMNAPVEIVVGRLVKRLEDQHYYPEQVAKLAIETWANALNIVLPKIATQNSVSQIPTPQIITSQSNISKPTEPIGELDQGVWTDTKTDLMWARISMGPEWKSGKCVGDAKALNWHDAQKECQDYRLAGYSDWRLPTIEELKGIMIPHQRGYAFHTKGGLVNTLEMGRFWSESLSLLKDRAWVVSFDTGRLHNTPFYHRELVRAVRNNVLNFI